MSFVPSFIDKKFDVQEKGLGTLHCKSGLSGVASNETLLGAISELKLDINDWREQGYDGAAAVSGSKNGMAAHIMNINPKAVYTHCFSHRLNISICKRQLLLLECVELFAPDADKKLLKDVCQTH